MFFVHRALWNIIMSAENGDGNANADGLVARLDMQNQIKTRVKNRKEECFLRDKLKNLEKSHNAFQKAHEREVLGLERSLTQAVVRTPNFKSFWENNSKLNSFYAY